MADRAHAIMNDLNRRAREVGLFEQKLTLDDLAAVRAFYDFTCLKCGKNPATSIDHVIPLIHGGQNTRANLQLLDTDCNKAKGDSDTDYRNGRICPDDFTAPTAKTNKTHDWFAIEREYITTIQSQRDLAEKYGVEPAEIGRFASANNWLEKRQQFHSETTAKMVELIAQARAEENVAAMDLCDAMITQFMREMSRGKAKITAFDAMAAARFREVLRGGVSNRTENVSKDWRDFAKDAGLDEDEVYAEFERIARERGQVVDGRGAFGSREQEEYGAGWSD